MAVAYGHRIILHMPDELVGPFSDGDKQDEIRGSKETPVCRGVLHSKASLDARLSLSNMI